MRALVLAALASLLLASAASTAPSPAVSSITLDQPALALGDVVTFATSVEKLAGWEYPMIAVSCYQDVNGDGIVDTSLLGPDIVFSWLDHPDAGFLLGGYSSIWTLRGGGPAVCRADLDAYGWKGGHQSVRVLASTGEFPVTG